jgi:hypothetical protein
MARQLADGLEAATIPYAVGGALALGVWAFPRATLDVDLNVFVPIEDLARVFVVLEAAGCTVTRESALARAASDGYFEAYAGPMRIDVFVPSIPFYENVRRRIRQATLEGRPAWYLSPEDLAVMKLLFFRPKDLLDLERLVALRAADFDRRYVERAIESLLGTDDPRLREWRALLERIDAQG